MTSPTTQSPRDDFPFWEMLPNSSVEMWAAERRQPSAVSQGARARADIDDGLDGENGLRIRVEVAPHGDPTAPEERLIFSVGLRAPLNAGLEGFKGGDGIYSYGAEAYCLHMAAELEALAAQMRRLAVTAHMNEERVE